MACVVYDEVIISFVCFGSLCLFVAVVVIPKSSSSLSIANDVKVCFVDVNNRLFRFGFNAFCFGSSNLRLDVIFSLHFSFISLR